MVQTSFSSGDQVAVVIPSAMGGAYDYRVGDGQSVQTGSCVTVPLGQREVFGVVFGPGTATLAPEKIKSVIGVVDCPPLPEDIITFINWMAAYTFSDLNAVTKLSVPVDPSKPVTTRGKTIDGTAPDPDHRGVILTSDQQDAARVLSDSVETGAYKALVLDGVTGAGKTEVYFEAVAAALRLGQQVLILQPEIALTAAFVERFKKRFGQAPALWHSGLTPVQRRKTWRGVLHGTIKVVAGARSALMLPFQNPGLIVVDEEHDAAYKQEEGVLYHARDMAVARAHHGGYPVILVSATPSLETAVNMWAGRYTAVTLPDRFGDAVLPDVRLIDLRSDKPDRQHFIAPSLIESIKQTLERREQALLFLNRRGYAPLTLCRTCGHRLMCPRCTAWMVAHRKTGRLHCHHCGYDLVQPKNCPSCNDTDSFVPCGPGVERIAEEVKAQFPDARTLVLSSDLADQPKLLTEALTKVAKNEVDIVVGTQIVAKGHHFPNLTLVGVIDADLGLSGGDLRAAERTFQLLQQVGGRAGRAEKRGTVLLQTFMPENKVMKALAAGARDPFLKLEAQERQAALMPPYGRLVAVIVSGTDEAKARAVAQDLARQAPETEGLTVWGPAEAPIFRLRGKSRFRLLLQAGRGMNVQKAVAEWLTRVKIPAAVSVRVDIDPQSFL